MQENNKRYWLLALVPLASCLILVGIFGRMFYEISADGIVAALPENLILAAVCLWALYALKSASILFPMAALQIAVGLIYPFPVALGVNLVGLVIALLLPYSLGRASGAGIQTWMLGKFPKLEKVKKRREENECLACFCVRIICPAPGDVVSWYQGAAGYRLWPFLIGTTMGKFTGMFIYTLMGDRLTEGLSWRLLALYVALLALSFLVSRGLNRLAMAHMKRKS